MPRIGDVDQDGLVNINDVTQLINILLSGTGSYPSGDVDQDGLVNINDVTTLIAMLLSSSNNYTYANALYDLNRVYASMRTYGWSTYGNFHQSFGISSHTLMAEVMGDDMIMAAAGSGWFWYDAGYSVKQRFTSDSWRSYDLWNSYYTWIANANYLEAACQQLAATDEEKDYITGQACAIRSYCYFMLAQMFARTYAGHQDDPCVPSYPYTVFNGTTGYTRLTVSQVYDIVMNEWSRAYFLMKDKTQLAPEHIGYSVLLGLRARIALVMEDWPAALSFASEAINVSGKRILEVSEFKGVNDVQADNVMWGVNIPADESAHYPSFWAHMDPSKPYFQRAPKQISKWLYNKMSSTDARQAWWGPNDTGVGSDAPISLKFNVVDGTDWEGDYIFMRIEEMYLIAAEAACRRNLPNTSRNYLNQLMAKRDPNYSCTKTGTSLGALTTDETGSLLEEILIQRRLELWGEDGRIFTIRRLRQGFERTTGNGWPASLTGGHAWYDPECYAWVMTIPFSEFTGDGVMNINTDQNPLGDYPDNHASGPQNVSFLQSTHTTQTPLKTIIVNIPIKRAVGQGEYSAIINIKEEGESAGHVFLSNRIVQFADGVTETSVPVTFEEMEIGKTYSAMLELSDADINNSSASLGTTITSTQVVVNCRNGNPSGQNISFETSEISLEAPSSGASMIFPVTITRDKTTDSYAVGVVISENDGHGYLNPAYSRVVFDEGVDSYTIYPMFQNINNENNYTMVLSLVPVDGSASDPAINGITSIRLNCVARSYTTLGRAYYYSPLWGDNSVYVGYNAQTDQYRLENLAGEGFNIIFTIDNSGKVYIEEQGIFYYGEDGLVYMVGNADGNRTGYAGTYDSSTKIATLRVFYYIPGLGSFGTFDDELTMP